MEKRKGLLKKIKKASKEEGYLRKDTKCQMKKKDVTVHVTGVSMSGGVKNDSKRSVTTDQRKSGTRKGWR